MDTRFNSELVHIHLHLYLFLFSPNPDSTIVIQFSCNSNNCVPFRSKISHNKGRKRDLGLGDIIDIL